MAAPEGSWLGELPAKGTISISGRTKLKCGANCRPIYLQAGQ